MKLNLVQLILVLLLTCLVESSKLSDKASYISNSEFEFRVQLSVVWCRSDPGDVTAFLTKYQGSVKTIYIDALIDNQTIAFQQAILFITTYHEFLYFVDKMDTKIIVPSKVIVILSSLKTESVLNLITETAWEHDIADLIILNSEDAGQTVEMFTYFPYSSSNGCGNTSAVKMDLIKSNFYPRKFNNFHGCEVNISGRTVFPYFICTNNTEAAGDNGGIFKKWLTILFGCLNTTLNWMCAGEVKGDSDGPGFELIHKKYDVYASIFLDENFIIEVLSLPILYFCEIAWCGPPQREIYAWAKVIFPMISNITALLGITLFMLAVVLKVIHRIESYKGNKKSPQIVWTTLAIFLGQQANYVSKSFLMNLLFLLWIWFSLIVGLIYQGELVRGLQTQHLEPRFGTLENAIKLLDGYGGSRLMKYYQKGTSIEENFEVLPYETVVSYIPEIANGKRFLVATDKLRMKGYTSLQFLDKSVIHLPLAPIVRPRWGAIVELESLTLRSAESGLSEKLFRDLYVELTKQVVHSSSQQWSTVSLDLVTLSTCFYGLAIMYILCFVIFCIEIVYDWLFTPSIKGVFEVRNVNKVHLS
ncbi:uncharacterized protein [Choristoneura fumiferana]|uniref:uncharacterized protein n=1 Tax=Choristoneura fumiferana TaxID=7141 RepID=UPI003D158F72